MPIRDTTTDDFAQILQINHASVHFLSPLTGQRLALLHGMATYHRVAQHAGQIQAFLLAFREGCAYDSPNYRWFSARYDRFLYVDRIVVSSRCQGRGIAPHLYEDLFAFALQSGAPRVTLEIDSDPPNPVSARFHARYGFREVGSQWLGAGAKRVSLQALPGDPAPA
jgi:predicted GNAT superfamily acetyltransferase